MAPCSIMAQNLFCTRRTLKTWPKIQSAFRPATPPARYARRGGPLLCPGNCHRARRSMTMRLNLPRPFPPMRIIYGGMAITPFWLARCIMSARISFMALKHTPQPIFTRPTLAEHRITANRVSGLIGGIIIWARSPLQGSSKSAIRWNMMMKWHTARCKRCISLAAAKMNVHGV